LDTRIDLLKFDHERNEALPKYFRLLGNLAGLRNLLAVEFFQTYKLQQQLLSIIRVPVDEVVARHSQAFHFMRRDNLRELIDARQQIVADTKMCQVRKTLDAFQGCKLVMA
jgi:hypothetical protein